MSLTATVSHFRFGHVGIIRGLYLIQNGRKTQEILTVIELFLAWKPKQFKHQVKILVMHALKSIIKELLIKMTRGLESVLGQQVTETEKNHNLHQ